MKTVIILLQNASCYKENRENWWERVADCVNSNCIPPENKIIMFAFFFLSSIATAQFKNIQTLFWFCAFKLYTSLHAIMKDEWK